MIILTAVWLFLPAGFANMVPVVAGRIPGMKSWSAPLDFGRSYSGYRIFGPNKTWRGLFAGIAIATVLIVLQRHIQSMDLAFIDDISWLDYQTVNIWLLGPLFGAGAILGDAAKSFFKRRRNIAAGDSWLPFDQIDYIIGGLLLTAPLVKPSLELILAVLAVYFGLHLVVVYIFFKLGIRQKPI